MRKFSDLGLAESLLRAVSAEGYTTPTPIQAKAIPPILEGKDIIGIAQTGTGKTASFVLPLLHRIGHHQGNRPARKSCTALILTPTRELAAQIADNIRLYGRFMKLSVAVVVGGVKPAPQIRTLSAGPDIVVATPGRLLDHLTSGGVHLGRTAAVVLDEADQMLDLGFMPTVRKIMSRLPAARQVVLMSATMPEQIRKLARDFQTGPVEVSVAPAARPVERIDQSVIQVDSSAKRRVLTDLLSEPDVERAIVFTRTKRGADKVNLHLQKAGLSAAAIHGDKSQQQRNRTLAAFRSGQTPILVATDIAARGIDVDDVSLVVNFELPHVAEAYVHRIGRTARAGRKGVAISLCDPAERKLLRDIERLVGNPLDRRNEAGGTSATAPAAPKPAHTIARKPGRKRRRRTQASRAKPPALHASHPERHNRDHKELSAGLSRMLDNTRPADNSTVAA